jgi:hypothetical protein
MQSNTHGVHSRTQIAQYAGSMAIELRNMCRRAQLHDLAYLFEVAANEAAQVRQHNAAELAPPSLAAIG